MKRYEHDCKQCVFLGTFEEYDLYGCPQTGHNTHTVLARYGDDDSDYHSCPLCCDSQLKMLKLAKKLYVELLNKI